MISSVQLFSHGSPAELGSASSRSSAFAFTRGGNPCAALRVCHGWNQRCAVQPLEILSEGTSPTLGVNQHSKYQLLIGSRLRSYEREPYRIMVNNPTVENYQVTVSDYHWLAILKHDLPVGCGYTIIVVIIAGYTLFSLVGYTTGQVHTSTSFTHAVLLVDSIPFPHSSLVGYILLLVACITFSQQYCLVTYQLWLPHHSPASSVAYITTKPGSCTKTGSNNSARKVIEIR